MFSNKKHQFPLAIYSGRPREDGTHLFHETSSRNVKKRRRRRRRSGWKSSVIPSRDAGARPVMWAKCRPARSWWISHFMPRPRLNMSLTEIRRVVTKPNMSHVNHDFTYDVNTDHLSLRNYPPNNFFFSILFLFQAILKEIIITAVNTNHLSLRNYPANNFFCFLFFSLFQTLVIF